MKPEVTIPVSPCKIRRVRLISTATITATALTTMAAAGVPTITDSIAATPAPAIVEAAGVPTITGRITATIGPTDVEAAGVPTITHNTNTVATTAPAIMEVAGAPTIKDATIVGRPSSQETVT